MKKIILLATIASALVFQDPFDNKSLSAPTRKATSLPAAQTEQSSTISNPAMQPSPAITSPPDVSPVVLKEILSANNQVVSQVASMYQNFGILITIIVSLVGVFAGVLGFYATRSVREFLREWNNKMESLEKATKSSLESWDREIRRSVDKVHEAVAEAENSANKAAEHARSIEDNKIVLNKTLEDVDQLRARVEWLRAQVGAEEPGVGPARTVPEAEVAQPLPEPISTEEEAEVAARLKDKIDPKGDEG